MTEDLYQLAKSEFVRLVDAPEAQREVRLSELSALSPELANEVRSLLEYHTAKSLIVPSHERKIRTRSTLSTTFQSRSSSWLREPLKAILISVPFVLLATIIIVWALQAVHGELELRIAQRLSSVVNHHLTEFRQWEKIQIDRALAWSQHPSVLEPIRELVKSIQDAPHDETELRYQLIASNHSEKIADALKDLAGSDVCFRIWDRRLMTVAHSGALSQAIELANFVAPEDAALIAPVMKGTPRLFTQFNAQQLVKLCRSGGFTFAIVPIQDSRGSIVAALMLSDSEMDDQFISLLSNWEMNTTCEVYFLSSHAELLTASRYEEQFDSLGITEPNVDDFHIMVRDPGINLLTGKESVTSPDSWPPTLLARQATSGSDGIDVAGYRNYVGQQVVGAWRWLPDHEVALAFEEDYSSSYALDTVLRNAFGTVAVLFSVGLIGLTIATSASNFSGRKSLDVNEAGPYRIQELLGEGGMGRVYLAEHALLCRQSAVKVLTRDGQDLSVITRFEREVQLASQLTHPNTISIYDFGRNKDGLFYYAMEYIQGAHLGQLVEYAGPVVPGRCIFILKQLCRALNEAHQAGVVHRDIKPQNVMVCNRGGEPDFVKLFDYGLVKAFAPGVSHTAAQTRVVVGTPRFLAPERLNSPWLADPRVDVYSIGALAYFLLTAQLPPLVTLGESLHEQPGIETLDLPPSVIEFGGLLSVCLAVEPAARPSGMHSLLRELEKLSLKFKWTREDSVAWWTQHESKLLQLVKNKQAQLRDSSRPHF
ncbi:MAG: serine/threonine protein kinase [Planctomycetales bacterium]|nr:serine/threonine protein kinase [Planctomycetales bacterium]